MIANHSYAAYLAGCLLLLVMLAGCGQPEVIKARYITQEKYPANSEAETVDNLYVRAVSLYERTELDSAEVCFRRVVHTAPEDWRPRYFLGLIAYAQGDYRRAEDQLTTCLNLAGEDAVSRSLVYVALGQTCEAEHQFGQARMHFMTALNLYPESTGAVAGLQRLELLSEAGR